MEILKPYRQQIDQIDRELIALLRKRYDVIDQVSVIKLREGMAPVLQDRVDEVRENAASLAAELGMDADFIRDVWAQLIAHSCETEAQYIRDQDDDRDA